MKSPTDLITRMFSFNMGIHFDILHSDVIIFSQLSDLASLLIFCTIDLVWIYGSQCV